MTKPITNADILRHYSEIPAGGPVRLELLRDAAAIIDGIPDKQFDLQLVYQPSCKPDYNPNDCGTVACALGWLGLHPGFQALGLAPQVAGGVKWQDLGVDFVVAAMKLFNLDEKQALSLFGVARIREEFPRDGARLTHKQVFWNRINRFVKQERLRRHSQEDARYDLGS